MVILKLTNASSFINLTEVWAKTRGSDVCSCILFFHMIIVKHETHHLHDFMVKFVIFNVNRVNFDQKQCNVILIQCKRRSKNRPSAETIAPLLLTRRSCLTLTRCSCSRCECTHLLTCMPKKIRAAHACGVHQGLDLLKGIVHPKMKILVHLWNAN